MYKIIRRQPVNDSHLNHPNALIRQLYAQRGITSDTEKLQLKGLLAPNTMLGLDRGAAIISDAIMENRRIVISGDFDADGATSTAVCMLGLEAMGAKSASFVIPNRFDYGYGLSPEVVKLVQGQGCDVLVTVDNGISSIEGVAAAKAAGMQVVVTDHHLPGETLPDADAIINPNQPGCPFASKSIAGVGVAFYLMLGVRAELRRRGYFERMAEPNLIDLIDIVALGTVADVVALDYNNRILVQAGLKRVKSGNARPGIIALFEVAKRNPWQAVASDFGFAVGPRLNAAGRLDEMSLGVNILIEPDSRKALMMAQRLDALNLERRSLEAGMQQEALIQLEELNIDEHNVPNALALFEPSWHQGVIGILASRIKERYHRPTIVFASDDEGNVKGSARSVEGVHMRDVLDRVNTLLPGAILKFGGHAMAAGLSIEPSRFSEVADCFDKVVTEQIGEQGLMGQIISDGELSASNITLENAIALREAGPWGQGFKEPVFDGEFHLVTQRIVGEKHLKLMLESPCRTLTIDAIAFNIDLKHWPDLNCNSVQLAYRLDVNEFRNQQSVQLMVEHIEKLA